MLTLVCAGLTNPEIAQHMNISLRTVEHYMSELLRKTRTRNRVGLVLYGLGEPQRMR